MKRFVGILFILALLALVLPVLAQGGDPTDSDGDGVPDDVEIAQGTDPNHMDTNGDGVPDGATQSVQADGSIVTVYADGRQITQKPEYAVETQYPADYSDPKLAGVTVTDRPDGTQTTTYPAGFSDAEMAGATVTVKPDGTKITSFPPDHPESYLAGATETESPDGTITTTFPPTYPDATYAGTTVVSKPDGTEVITYPTDHADREMAGATVTIQPDGTKTTSFPPDHPESYLAGATEIESPDGTITTIFPPTYADPEYAGTTVIQKPDGTMTTTYPTDHTIPQMAGATVIITPDGQATTTWPPDHPDKEVAGATEIVKPDGTITTTFPPTYPDATYAGTTVTIQPDGTQVMTSSDGTQATTYLLDHADQEMAGATVTVKPDGTKITSFPPDHPESYLAGATETEHPDGTITTTFPPTYPDATYAGTTVVSKPDETEVITYPTDHADQEMAGATVTIQPDGTEITTWPPDHPDNEVAGATETVKPDGTLIATFPLGYPDPSLAGATVTIQPDGTEITTWPQDHPDNEVAGATEIVRPDGTVVTTFPPGYPDSSLAGTTAMQRPDGTTIMVKPDGSMVEVNEDGTETPLLNPNVSSAEGTEPEDTANGAGGAASAAQHETAAQQPQVSFSDGTTVTRNADGTYTITGPDGQPYNCVCTPVSSGAASASTKRPPHNDPTGDVYDYYLKHPANLPSVPWADMTNGYVAAGSWGNPISSVWPGPTGTSAWITMGPGWTPVVTNDTFTFTSNGQVTGQGTGIFSAPDRSFVIDGSTWGAQFGPDGGVSLQTTGSADFGIVDIQYYSYDGTFGPYQTSFGGAIVAGTYDADAETLVITLVEGTLTFNAPIQAGFSGPDDGATALVVRAAPDGTFEEQVIALDEAQMAFPPAFRSLTFSIDMQQPIAATRQEAEQVWGMLVDVDADLATGVGYTVDTNPMYANLGVDFIVWILLQDDGSFETQARFVDAPADQLPVDVSLSPDRRTLTLYVPMAAFAAQAEALGMPFAQEMLRWRMAAVNYSGEEPVKDVFPEMAYNYATGALDMPVPEAEMPPQVPNNTQFGYGHSISGGGPVVTFEDTTVSGDPNIPITGWLWDFGDGTTSNEQNPQHSYQDAGTYEVTVTYTFANGAALSFPFSVEVAVGSGVAPADTAAEGSEAPAEPAASELAGVCTASASGGANLRGGPGTGFAQVGSVAGGDSLAVVGQNAAGDWYKLQIEGIDSAWIAAFLITAPTCPDGITLPVMSG